MPAVDLPQWASMVVERAGARPGDDISDMLTASLDREVSLRLGTAAERLASELSMRETLLAGRAMLEKEQVALLAAAGRVAKAETNLGERRFAAYRWGAAPLPTPETLYRAIVLLDVVGLDDLAATMELNSRRATVHFECFELAHDNQVIGFHNAALRSRPGAAQPRSTVSDREGEGE